MSPLKRNHLVYVVHHLYVVQGLRHAGEGAITFLYSNDVSSLKAISKMVISPTCTFS